MLAKLCIAIAAFIALAPHIETLKFRILAIGLSVGALSGLIGTATREQPFSMVPVNAAYGVAVSTVVTLVLHAAFARFSASHAPADLS